MLHDRFHNRWEQPTSIVRASQDFVTTLKIRIAKDGSIDRDFLWWLHEGNRALRVGNWKIVTDKDQPWELYDLSTDRAEQHNLASQMPDKVRELSAAWQAQTDRFTELAKQTLAEQPVGKGKKKDRAKAKRAKP